MERPSTYDRSRLTTPAEVRQACREGAFDQQTSGLAPSYAQANLAILPRADAADFLQFCLRNPKPCPLLEVTAAGDPVPHKTAPEADLRTDLPRYRVWRKGELVAEPDNIRNLWQNDFVAFLIGCSFTFESALLRQGVPVRHLELGTNVPMFRTNIACEAAGKFGGPMVVSMRPLRPADAIRAVQITSQFPRVHGAPIHLGFPGQIGIEDLSKPDFGEAVPVGAEEMPVFWACGVTPQQAIMQARPEIAITHSPGCMFVTDVDESSLEGLAY